MIEQAVKNEQYYPCMMNDDTGQISRRVGPAMTHEAAVQYLKQHYSGAWQRARAAPQPVSHPFFALDDSPQKSE